MAPAYEGSALKALAYEGSALKALAYEGSALKALAVISTGEPVATGWTVDL